MKKALFIYTIVGAFLSGCTNDELIDELVNQEGTKISFSTAYAAIEDGADTRLNLVNGKDLINLESFTVFSDESQWEESDETEEKDFPSSFKLISKESGSYEGEEVSGTKFYALSPDWYTSGGSWYYDREHPDKIAFHYLGEVISYRVTLYTSFTVAFGSRISSYLDENEVKRMPMIAYSKDNHFRFRQTMGLCHFTLDADMSVYRICLSGNNGEALGGVGYIDINSDDPKFIVDESSDKVLRELDIDNSAYADGRLIAEDGVTVKYPLFLTEDNSAPKEFYIPIPAQVYSKGLTLKVIGYDNDSVPVTLVKTTNTPISVGRGVVKKFAVLNLNDKLEQLKETIPFVDQSVKETLVSLYDLNGDGELSYAEVEAVKDLSFSNDEVSSSEDLKYFSNATRLKISSNSIESLIMPDNVEVFEINCPKLKSITFSKRITKIPDDVFSGCTSLTSVVIPEGVTEIGSSAFSGCSSLTSIVIPDGVIKIGSSAFSGCSSLKSVSLPTSLTSISDYAFCGCPELSEVTLADGLVSIGKYAFSPTQNSWEETTKGKLTGINLPSTLNYIGERAFACQSIRSINIPNSLKIIPSGAFLKCDDLSEINLPESIETIDNYAFAYCTSLTSISFPKGLTSLASTALAGCTNISSITFSDGSLSAIEPCMFSNFKKLTSIVIPQGVTSIGNKAFYNCTNLTSVTLPDDLVSIGEYAFAMEEGQGKLASIVIPQGVTSIGNNAFYNCANLTSVTLPDGLVSIGEYAFAMEEGRGKLASINLPSTLTSIGQYAFKGSSIKTVTVPSGLTALDYAFAECWNLRNVTILEGVTSIKYAFSGCNRLSSITIPNSVLSMEGAFRGCGNLTSVNIPNGVKSIAGTFNGCSILESVDIPESVTNIDGAFCGCTNLSSANIPSGVKSIGNYTFYKCKNLSSVNIPLGINTIGSQAFYDCLKLAEIELPDGLISIGESAFALDFDYGELGLKSIVIPNSVTSIGNRAFEFCEGLESITLPSGLTSINWSTFYACSSLTFITIPSHITEIGDFAFYGCHALTSVTALPTTAPFLGENAFDVTNNAPIYVPAGSIEDYKDEWFDYADRIEAIPE